MRRRARAVAAAALLVTSSASAEPSTEPWRGELEAEYLAPTHDDRQIRTLSLHARVGRKLLGLSWLSWRAGVTLTTAWGNIVQLDESFRDVRRESSATGAGPTGSLRLSSPPLWGLSLGADASGGLLLYSREFPAGGDVYNFMWRAGLFVEERAAPVWLGAGLHVMHVSNGQGLGPHNPSYEARGVGMWLALPL